MELTLRRLIPEDKELIESYLKKKKTRSCEMTFLNTLLWSQVYPTGFTVIDDMLVYGSLAENRCSFTFPWGEHDPRSVLDKLMKYSEEKGVPFQLHNITKESFEELERLYPGCFEIRYSRDYSDYVYETEALAHLSGRKYHGKKNHVNKFKKLYPDWTFESFSKENAEEVYQMALRWKEENNCDEDEGKSEEIKIALQYIRLIEQHDLQGGVLRVGGNVIAFCIAEPVCDDTMVVHIEKALREYDGAYAMINQQFAISQEGKYRYLNREEDMGEEGLRQAKLSYQPAFLVEKGVVRRIGEFRNEE